MFITAHESRRLNSKTVMWAMAQEEELRPGVLHITLSLQSEVPGGTFSTVIAESFMNVDDVRGIDINKFLRNWTWGQLRDMLSRWN